MAEWRRGDPPAGRPDTEAADAGSRLGSSAGGSSDGGSSAGGSSAGGRDASAVVAGRTAELDPAWQQLLAPGCRSAVIAAVGLGDGIGWLGLEDHGAGRSWSAAEVDAVSALAAAVGLHLVAAQDAATNALLTALVEHIPAVLYVDRVTGHEFESGEYQTLFITRQLAKILGISPAEWTTNTALWQRNMHPDDWERARREFNEYLHRDGTLVQEYRMIRPDDGRVVWIRDDCTLVRDESSETGILTGVMFDVSDQKRTEEQLRNAEAKYRTLVEQIPAVVFVDRLPGSHEPSYVSPSVETVLGCLPDEWLASSWWEAHLHPDDAERVLAARAALVAEGASSIMEYRMSRGDGRLVWIGEIAHVITVDGRPWVIQGLLEDISERKRAEEQLAFRASHDGLTGLPNRATFEEHLERALARAARGRLAVAVLFMDIDGFKAVNDTLGHESGDEVLREVARRLREAVRETDIVARRGGDEFLVLLADLDPGTAEPAAGAPATATQEAAGTEGSDAWSSDAGPPEHRLAAETVEMVTDRIREAMEPFIIVGGQAWKTSVSVGRSLYPADAVDFRTMMARADAAMYRAKQSAARDR